MFDLLEEDIEIYADYQEQTPLSFASIRTDWISNTAPPEWEP